MAAISQLTDSMAIFNENFIISNEILLKFVPNFLTSDV